MPEEMKFNTGAVIIEPGSTIKNKTGSWRTLRPVIDKSKCRKCGMCWMYCPDGAIDEKFDVNYDYCKGCGICTNTCPFNAIKMEKEEK